MMISVVHLTSSNNSIADRCTSLYIFSESLHHNFTVYMVGHDHQTAEELPKQVSSEGRVNLG